MSIEGTRYPLTSPKSSAQKAEAYQNVGVRSHFDPVIKSGGEPCIGDGGFHQILGVKEKAEEVGSQQVGLESGQLYENVTLGSARSAHRKVRTKNCHDHNCTSTRQTLQCMSSSSLSNDDDDVQFTFNHQLASLATCWCDVRFHVSNFYSLGANISPTAIFTDSRKFSR